MSETSRSTAYRIIVTKGGKGSGPLMGTEQVHWLAMAPDLYEAIKIVRGKTGEVTGIFPQPQINEDEELARHEGIVDGEAKALVREPRGPKTIATRPDATVRA